MHSKILFLTFYLFTIVCFPQPSENSQCKQTYPNEYLAYGTESGGGGGSFDKQIFLKPLVFALERLSSQEEYVFNTKDSPSKRIVVKISELVSTLDKAKIISTEEQLYDRNGDKVDLYNDPNLNEIYYNTKKWSAKTEAEQVQMGLHEILGLLKMPDPYYSISNHLADFALANLNKNTMSFCGVSVSSFSYAIENTNVEALKKNFILSGALVKTCQTQYDARLKNYLYTAVVGVYLEQALVLLIKNK